jgi:hypothetical protein
LFHPKKTDRSVSKRTSILPLILGYSLLSNRKRNPLGLHGADHNEKKHRKEQVFHKLLLPWLWPLLAGLKFRKLIKELMCIISLIQEKINKGAKSLSCQ